MPRALDENNPTATDGRVTGAVDRNARSIGAAPSGPRCRFAILELDLLPTETTR